MTITELEQVQDECTLPLRTLYQQTGDRLVSGFLGGEIERLELDEDGHLFFSTHREREEVQTDSRGVILDTSILIKQRQKGREDSFYRIYSWDLDAKQYTMLSFDGESSMNRFFNVMKRFDMNIGGEDITEVFRDMGLTFDSVNQILLNQSVNPMDELFVPDPPEDSYVL